MKIKIETEITAENKKIKKKKIKKKIRSPNRNTFKRFTREDSHSWNIANYTGSTAG
jgi:hypothetical protein